MCLKSPGTDVGAASFERCPRTFETHFIYCTTVFTKSSPGTEQKDESLQKRRAFRVQPKIDPIEYETEKGDYLENVRQFTRLR